MAEGRAPTPLKADLPPPAWAEAAAGRGTGEAT